MTNLITLKISNTNNQLPTQNKNNELVDNKYWLMSVDKNNENNHKHKVKRGAIIGASIATSILLTGGAIFFISRGGSNKTIIKWLEKKQQELITKIQLAKLDPTNTNVFSLNKNIYLAKLLEQFENKAQLINNYTSVKDTLFKKLMTSKIFNYKNIGTRIHNKITAIFENLGKKAVINSYQSSLGQLKEILLANDEIIKNILSKNPNELVEINGVAKTRKQWCDIIREDTRLLSEKYNSTFTDTGFSKRYNLYKEITTKLGIKFKNPKELLLNKDLVRQFIADGIIKPGKTKIIQEIKTDRDFITYSRKDFKIDIDALLLELTKNFDFKDRKILDQLNNIRKEIHLHIKQPATDSLSKEKIIKEIKTLKEIIQTDNKYNNENILKTIETIETKILNSPKGKIENILEIYEHLLSEDSYKATKETYKTFTKSFDKSIKLETEDFINKLRDLAVGSAPTDVLSMLGGVWALGYGLARADDNDQRISISLKYGIPALTGIGASLYFNAKLFAGSKALLSGLASMYVTNRLGEYADKLRKKHLDNKFQTNQISAK